MMACVVLLDLWLLGREVKGNIPRAGSVPNALLDPPADRTGMVKSENLEKRFPVNAAVIGQPRSRNLRMSRLFVRRVAS